MCKVNGILVTGSMKKIERLFSLSLFPFCTGAKGCSEKNQAIGKVITNERK